MLSLFLFFFSLLLFAFIFLVFFCLLPFSLHLFSHPPLTSLSLSLHLALIFFYLISSFFSLSNHSCSFTVFLPLPFSHLLSSPSPHSPSISPLFIFFCYFLFIISLNCISFSLHVFYLSSFPSSHLPFLPILFILQFLSNVADNLRHKLCGVAWGWSWW